MNTQQWLEAISDAGFVKLSKADLSASAFALQILGESYSTTACYFHSSVLEMPKDEQKQQPWIEHHVFAKRFQKPDVIEGRFGAMRYPFRRLNDFWNFMQIFGYTQKLITN